MIIIISTNDSHDSQQYDIVPWSPKFSKIYPKNIRQFPRFPRARRAANPHRLCPCRNRLCSPRPDKSFCRVSPSSFPPHAPQTPCTRDQKRSEETPIIEKVDKPVYSPWVECKNDRILVDMEIADEEVERSKTGFVAGEIEDESFWGGAGGIGGFGEDWRCGTMKRV